MREDCGLSIHLSERESEAVIAGLSLLRAARAGGVNQLAHIRRVTDAYELDEPLSIDDIDTLKERFT